MKEMNQSTEQEDRDDYIHSLLAYYCSSNI